MTEHIKLTYPALQGIRLYAMGDSYFAGNGIERSQTWVNRLCDKYGMDYVNYGIGGSTMSDYVTTKKPMVERILQMEKADADIILLEGGRNDLNNGVPLGEIGSRDTKTFRGAINFMLDYLLKTYPKALIILITPWKYTAKRESGYDNITYADVMRSISDERADIRITCLYAADSAFTQVDMDDPDFRAKYSIKPSDPSHLNADGMSLVLPHMEKFIAEAYMAYLNPPTVHTP